MKKVEEILKSLNITFNYSDCIEGEIKLGARVSSRFFNISRLNRILNMNYEINDLDDVVGLYQHYLGGSLHF